MVARLEDPLDPGRLGETGGAESLLEGPAIANMLA